MTQKFAKHPIEICIFYHYSLENEKTVIKSQTSLLFRGKRQAESNLFVNAAYTHNISPVCFLPRVMPWCVYVYIITTQYGNLFMRNVN